METKKTVNIAVILTIVVLAVSVAYSAMTAPSSQGPDVPFIPFPEDWILSVPDGTERRVSFKHKGALSAPNFSISKQLPEELPDQTVLVFKTGHKWIEATVDGIPLEIDGMHQGGRLGIKTADRVAAISLPQQYSGHNIVLQTGEKSGGVSTDIFDFYLMDYADLRRLEFHRMMPFAILSIFLCSVSIALFVIGIMLGKKNDAKVHLAIVYFSIFVFMAAIWILFDCKVLELLSSYSEVQYLMSFYALMLMPIPFALFVRELCTRGKWVFDLMVLLFTASFLLNVALLYMGIIHSLIQVIPITHILIIAMIVVTTYSILQPYSKLKEQGMREALTGIAFFAFADCIALGQFYFRTKISYSTAFCIGLSGLIVCLSASLVQYTLNMARLAQISEKNEMRASLAKNELLVSQINTHFFYHMMSTIRTLVKTQPDVAYGSLGSLSKYLRYKTESASVMGSLVKFSDEMKSVNAYISMQKILLGDRLHVEYENTCEDFYIPVLTIQPLVENAIKHGIEAKPQGGTVKITVSDADGFYRVVIQDDGNGFGTAVEFSTENVSVSQENIKSRLAYYGNNHFSIRSTPNLGTLVAVEFEKGLEEQHEDNSGR